MQTLSIPKNEVINPVEISEGDHIVGQFDGPGDGPTLLVFGSVHGNEHSGVRAQRRVARKLRELRPRFLGSVYLIAGNTRAINRNVRYVDSDLNRHWTPETVKRNRPGSSISTNRVEDIEQREILKIIEGAVSKARNEVYALDLHSTSSESTPFAMIGDTLRNRTFAENFPATFLLGIEEQLDGTIMEFMNDLGAVTLGFEAGMHTAGVATKNQESLIWLAMRNSGVLPPDAVPDAHFDALSVATGRQRIIEIRHRHAITPADGFKMEPGYENFQPVKKGELLARDRHGKIRARETGLVLMPLYQDQGSDGFFLGREVARFWLWLSRVLRDLRVGNLMPLLPGVKRHPENADSLIVDTRIARILPLQIFHLLGFRKRRWSHDQLIVSRRRHDTKSPFLRRK